MGEGSLEGAWSYLGSFSGFAICIIGGIFTAMGLSYDFASFMMYMLLYAFFKINSREREYFLGCGNNRQDDNHRLTATTSCSLFLSVYVSSSCQLCCSGMSTQGAQSCIITELCRYLEPTLCTSQLDCPEVCHLSSVPQCIF